MFNTFYAHRRTTEIALFWTGVVCAVLAAGILVSHASLFGQKRDRAVAIGLTLPDLKAEVELLTAQTEAEGLFFEQGLAAREEQAEVFILPTSMTRANILKTVQDIGEALREGDAEFTIEGMTAGVPEPRTINGSTIRTLPISLALRGNFQTMVRFFAVLGFSGDMMVRDVLSEEVRTNFLAEVEQASPLALGTAENFLYTDLLEYAADPDRTEQQLFSELPAEIAGPLRATLLEAGLRSVRHALDSVAAELKTAGTWPLPLLKIDAIKRAGPKFQIDLTAYARHSS